VQRTITVTSEPAGALVWLNDEEVGRTPVTTGFTFYGVYDVRLELERHKPLWTTGHANAPWWEAPGPDLLAEAVGAKSELAWHYEMAPAEPANADQLIEHGRQLRAMIDEEAAQADANAANGE